MDNTQRRFFIHTLGCKVNQYESQAMREILERSGFEESISSKTADVCIINTCTVTDKVDKESRRWISVLRKANPAAKIVVTGCYIEQGAEGVSSLPGIVHLVKNKDKGRIAEILGEDPGVRDSQAPLFVTDFKNHTRAFVKIQDGCENRCSYCKVPLVRSVLKSKPIDLIVREVEGLAARGFKEVVLAGICLGAWGEDFFPPELAKDAGIGPPGIADVLKALGRIGGDFRIRLSSIEPKYITDELIDLMAANKRVCRHLHIPLQSGDDETLKKMNRPYTAADFRRLADKIRTRIKDIAITTDIITGFPGERDDNFRNTVAFVKELVPARAHIFTFSKRIGTPAFSIPSDLSAETLRVRYNELKAVTFGTSYIYRKEFLDKRLDVLAETKKDRTTGLLTGYSDNYIKVIFNGPDEIMGKIVSVRIEDLNLMYTIGVYT